MEQHAAQRYRAIFESALDFAIVATDTQGRITDWNPGAERIFGWTADAMRGETAERFFTPEDRAVDRMALEMRCALETGRGNDERWHMRADGSRFWASGEMMPLRDGDGAHIGFLKILRDRTAERDAVARTRDDAEFMRSVMAASNDCIKVLDLDARLVFMSEGGQRVMEVSDFNAIRGCPWPDFWTGQGNVAAVAAVNAARAGRAGRFQAEAATMAGTSKWWDVQVTPIPGPDGQPQRLLSISRDVTDRVQDALAIRELNATLEQRVAERTRERDQSWKQSRDVLLVIDPDGVLRAVNQAWTEVLGWTADELVGRSCRDFVHPDDYADSLAALARAAEGVLPAFENRYRHRDGGWRWISWVASPADGLVYASGRHVTAEKEAAASLAAIEEQLRQSQKMEAVGQLTGGLAHDFNNLLASIAGSLELLQRKVAQGRTDDLERHIAVATSSTKRAAALTHRLLAFSRRQTLEPKVTDVNQLVAGMEELLRRTIGPAVELVVSGAGDLWRTQVDPHQLENALLNLGINARDAMPGGGRLTITTANCPMGAQAADGRGLPPGDYLSICVADTGTGMPPEVLARVFEPFFTTKPLGMGTGLGLSMVYGFARQSGGQVHVASQPGEGTTLCLYLPRHAGPSGAQEAGMPETPAGRGAGRVLVVDDEASVRELLVEVLVELGYGVLQAGDAPHALALLQAGAAVDLLVTDVGLPGGLNGRQLADAGRALQPGLRVLFITGYAETAVLQGGDLEPGMQVLSKPFTLDALAARVGALLPPA